MGINRRVKLDGAPLLLGMKRSFPTLRSCGGWHLLISAIRLMRVVQKEGCFQESIMDGGVSE